VSALSTSELQEIANSLTALRSRPDDEELRERIRDAFQQRGFFDTEVTHLKVVPLDPIADPKPIRLEAEVQEGPRFTFAAIRFVGNHALSGEQLRQLFPIHAGEVFETGKVVSGLQAMRDQYSVLGFMDMRPIPTTEKVGSAQIMLTLNIIEGPQYRMGTLEIEGGKSELAQQLYRGWELDSGQPFDPAYPDKFLGENRSLLPTDFQQSRDSYILRDCHDLTVAVHINLEPNISYAPKHDAPCEQPTDSSKQHGP
jgi:outer membrane protein assembly factor BamA